MSGYQKMQNVVDILGEDKVLEELLQILSDDQLKEYAGYIEQDYDLDIEF